MTDSPPAWELVPGDSIRRTLLHERYGGSGRGGIAPSARSPNVLIFSDVDRGRRHGYLDGWRADGRFHYTGEGKVGDQELAHGNRKIAGHILDGRALRVFDGVAGTVNYVGEFRLDAEPYRTDAPESEDAPSRGQVIRQVIVFPLLPVDSEAPHASDPAVFPVTAGPALAEVPVERQNTERAVVNPSGEVYEVERREQRLVLEYREFLVEQGIEVTRHRIQPPGEAKPLYSDLFDKTRRNVIEAKGSGTRANLRMAIGQLADYGRFIEPPASPAVLLSDRPRPDLEELLQSEGIAVIWQTESGFDDNAAGAFV